MRSSAFARAYTDALDRQDDAAAAALLAEDVELVYPHGSIRGRATWLETRARQDAPRHLEERVERAEFAETPDGAVMRGVLVQRWIESGEVASELPVHVAFSIADGEITRVEMTASD